MKKSRFTQVLIAALILVLLARLSLLNQYSLIGTTEPRYAELARKMLATGDWVTLWVTDGVPLWGKPPLLFWADALSASLLGMTEFALRLPQFLFTVIMLSLFWFWPYAVSGAAKDTARDAETRHQSALIASLVFMTTPLGFLAAGFVATDIYLTGALMLSMVSFWRVIQAERADTQATNIWHWSFFIGIAIGLLAKGPLTIVLLGASLFLWMMISPKGRVRLIWQCLPWFRGLLLMALIAFPWYILHEIRTPGFLNHFIIGEHFQRFLVKDWAGGRFAPSHGEPLGMIWWFAIKSFVPWLLLLIPAFFVAKRLAWRFKPSSDEQYLWCWLLSALLFFSFSKNVLDAYVLTSLPAFAILVQKLLRKLMEADKNWGWGLLLAIPVPFVITLLVFFFKPVLETQSQKHLLDKHWQAGAPIIYIADLPPSGIFYTANRAKEVGTLTEALALIQKQALPASTLLAMPEPVFKALPLDEKNRLQVLEIYGNFVMANRSP